MIRSFTVETRASFEGAARWGPSALLTAVALIQIALVYTGDLTAWKGGGFGMFSTLDYGTNRRFFAEGLDSSGKAVQVNLFAGDQRRHAQLRVKPDRAAIERLARDILGAELVVDRKEQVKAGMGLAGGWMMDKTVDQRPLPRKIARIKLPSDEPDPKELVRLTAVRISLWKKMFDPVASRLYWEQIGSPVTAGSWR